MRHLKPCLTNGDESGEWRVRRNDEVLHGAAALRDVRCGMVAYLAGTEAGFVTGANLSAPDCDGAKRLTRTNPDELEFHEGAWFGKARLMKSRPALAIRPWRDTRWGVKLSIDRPHLLSHQSSRDRESRVGLELARDFASRGLRG